MLYFAYGSNLSVPRLQARIPGAQFIGTGSLAQHQFRYHKKGKDGSAKADALFTGRDTDQIMGVIYRISPPDRPILSAIEDEGIGYELKPVLISGEGGAQVEAFTYVALHIDRSLLPFDWYHQHVLFGAKRAGFHEGYLEFLYSLQCQIDQDDLRRAKEQSIYNRR